MGKVNGAPQGKERKETPKGLMKGAVRASKGIRRKNPKKERKKKKIREAQKIPTAGSPTITLLRLNPSQKPNLDKKK
jgi:hypothetical protein